MKRPIDKTTLDNLSERIETVGRVSNLISGIVSSIDDNKATAVQVQTLITAIQVLNTKLDNLTAVLSKIATRVGA